MSSLNLVEKYRPVTLSDLVGQDDAVYQLREFLADPVPTAFIFAGSTGVGKSSAVKAFARELGVDPDCMVGGYTEVPAGDQTADRIRDLIRTLAIRPMLGTGWKVVVIEEGDRMSEACEYLWLSALESLPRETVVIFTTNHTEKMSTRFLHRCETLEFTADADTIRHAVQARLDAIWRAETGRDDAPSVDSLKGVEADGEISVRAAIQALTPLIRKARRQPRIDWGYLGHAWKTEGQIVIEGRNGDEWVFRYHGEADIRSALQARVAEVWRAENGKGRVPDVADLLTGTTGRLSLAGLLVAFPAPSWTEYVPAALASESPDVIATIPSKAKPRKPRKKTA